MAHLHTSHKEHLRLLLRRLVPVSSWLPCCPGRIAAYLDAFMPVLVFFNGVYGLFNFSENEIAMTIVGLVVAVSVGSMPSFCHAHM